MKKVRINGREYVKLSTLRWEIKMLRDTIGARHGGFSDMQKNAMKVAYGDLIRTIYAEELAELLKLAETPEEIMAVHEEILAMPGDYIVFRRDPNDSKRFEYFKEFSGGGPVFGRSGEAMIFSFESKAKEIAERLGPDWIVMDASDEAHAARERLLKAIFGDEEGDEDDA